MATNVVAAANKQEPDDDDRRPSSRPPSQPGSGGGEPSFFAIYKKGQGYWTRMLTAASVMLILCLLAQFFYSHVLATVENKDLRLGIACGIIALGALLSWFVMNKATSVDFLIATDSEMKKVNWTSRAELTGSTKVVILFMFLIAFFLFGIDIFFGYFFYFIDVLKNKPF